MSLKSEIENYLLENDFYLVDDECTNYLFVYTHNHYKGHIVEILDIPEHKCISLNLKYNKENIKIIFINNFNVTKLNDVKFLLSNSSGSPIVNHDLFD